MNVHQRLPLDSADLAALCRRPHDRRERENILKRLGVHGGGLNLRLLMDPLLGVGQPRTMQKAARGLRATGTRYLGRRSAVGAALAMLRQIQSPGGRSRPTYATTFQQSPKSTFATS